MNEYSFIKRSLIVFALLPISAYADNLDLKVLLSDGAGGFAAPVVWTEYDPGTYGWQVGDFDGNGCDDIIRGRESQDNKPEVLISNCSDGFSRPSTWSNYHGGDGGFIVGDFNGDDTDDILRARPSQSNVPEILLSTRSSFNFTGRWSDWHGGSFVWQVGDFDGDGCDDIVRARGGTRDQDKQPEVFISNCSNSFSRRGFWSNYHAGDGGFIVGDFNGDDIDDTLRARPGQSNVPEILLSTRSSFNFTGRWSDYHGGTYIWQVGDFDGNGCDDIVRGRGSQDNRAEVFLSNCADAFEKLPGLRTRVSPAPVGWIVGNFDGINGDDLAYYSYPEPRRGDQSPFEFIVASVSIPQTKLGCVRSSIPGICGLRLQCRKARHRAVLSVDPPSVDHDTILDEIENSVQDCLDAAVAAAGLTAIGEAWLTGGASGFGASVEFAAQTFVGCLASELPDVPEDVTMSMGRSISFDIKTDRHDNWGSC